MSNYQIPSLPLAVDLETKRVFKKIIAANKALAELNGVSETIPNEQIILNTLSLQEAKDSSAIENIITTQDELFSSDSLAKQFTSIAAKEVFNYSSSLKFGFELVKETGLLTSNNIIDIHSVLEETKTGFRKVPGTALKNSQTGEITDFNSCYKRPKNLTCYFQSLTTYDSPLLFNLFWLYSGDG